MSVTGSVDPPLIDVRDLERTFDVRRRVEGRRRKARETVLAVHDLSFSVTAGEMVGYIGPNGAGKSTTIKMLTGILVPTGERDPVAAGVEAGDPDLSARRHQDPGEHLDRRRLASAVGADVADHLTGRD